MTKVRDLKVDFFRVIVNNRISGQAAHAERNLQLVPKHVLLLPKKRCDVEGTVPF